MDTTQSHHHENSAPHPKFKIFEYKDSEHAEVQNDLEIGEFGYKYRRIEGIVMPPFTTPSRYNLSRRLQTRPDDVCYTAYPKSGSTWLSYILTLIVHDGETPSDHTLRSNLNWVACSWCYPKSESELDALPSPRIFTSHMPYEMALGGVPAENPAKYVYIARNPKDVAVSYYHFEKEKSWAGNYSGTWEHWLDLFLNGGVQRGDWFDHVLSWWAHRTQDNILFIKYEDLKKDFSGSLHALTQFLDHPLSPEIMERIEQKTSFGCMQQEQFSNQHEIKELQGFFRKGKVSSWKDQFTDEQSAAFDRIIEKRLGGTGLEFEYE